MLDEAGRPTYTTNIPASVLRLRASSVVELCELINNTWALKEGFTVVHGAGGKKTGGEQNSNIAYIRCSTVMQTKPKRLPGRARLDVVGDTASRGFSAAK